MQADIEDANYIVDAYLLIGAIRERLKRIFQAYDIPFKEIGKPLENVYFKLRNQIIEDYFKCIPSNSILNDSYKLIAMKPELVQKIEESI